MLDYRAGRLQGPPNPRTVWTGHGADRGQQPQHHGRRFLCVASNWPGPGNMGSGTFTRVFSTPYHREPDVAAAEKLASTCAAQCCCGVPWHGSLFSCGVYGAQVLSHSFSSHMSTQLPGDTIQEPVHDA
eukprot:2200541-Prymnesium_polylepis.1